MDGRMRPSLCEHIELIREHLECNARGIRPPSGGERLEILLYNRGFDTTFGRLWETFPMASSGQPELVSMSSSTTAPSVTSIDSIVIRGARVHNLKNVDIEVPHNTLTVLTGVSGSGKSSLAFDTIYAEGQRRYVESLSAYARQFLERIEKPDADSIDGIAPAVAIKQKNTTRNPRSTVATATEIYDYLRLLFARVGRTYCANCGQEVKKDTVDEIADAVLALDPETRVQVVFPLQVAGTVAVEVEKKAGRPRKTKKAAIESGLTEQLKARLFELRKAGFRCSSPSWPMLICGWPPLS